MGIAGLSSHRRLMQKATTGVLAQLEAATATTEIDVVFIAGAQTGARRRMKVTELVIGAGAGSDIVLLDGAAVDAHVRIQFQKSAFGTLAEVAAMGPGVTVAGAALPAGTVATDVTLPSDITVGGTTLRFSRAGFRGQTAAPVSAAEAAAPAGRDSGRDSGSVRSDPILGIGLIAMACVILLGIGWQVFGARDTFVVDVNQPPVASLAAAEVQRDWIGELRGQIEARDLSKSLEVRQMQDGILRLRGQVSEVQLTGYRQLQAWFDSQPSTPPIVWDVSQRTSLTGLPAIGLVRVSAPAAVILTNGSTVTVGEPLTEGWILAGVDHQTLTLKRGLETQQVNYKANLE